MLATLSGLDGKDAKTNEGIYKLEGDVLTICLASGGSAQRPTEFKTSKEHVHSLFVLKKVKE